MLIGRFTHSISMISVGVFVDLKWQASAGGHVKCWEHFAQAATEFADQIDLTLHFLGDRPRVISIADNVRYVIHPFRFSTERIFFLKDVPDHTDLSSFNPALLPYLEQHDVVHTTHPLFTFGKTALHYCQRTGKPLVTSIHTDTPQYARIYIEQKIQGVFGEGWIGKFLQHTLQIPRRYQRFLERRLQRYWQNCDRVFASQPRDWEQVAQVLPQTKLAYLRRGIDFEKFNPLRRDRAALSATYGIPGDRFWLLYVGRLDECKNVMTFVAAVQQLLAQNLPVHAVVVGKGSSASDIAQGLAEHVSMIGTVDYTDLGAIYASADLFVFPSETETVGNVVLEAKASGLPVLVAGKGGTPQLVRTSGVDGQVIYDPRPGVWAQAIAELHSAPENLEKMRFEARRSIVESWPAWSAVLAEDLLPIWQALGQTSPQAALPSRTSPQIA